MDIDEFTEVAGEIVDSVPEPLMHDLNGGIIVSERARRDRDAPPGVYILGEYRVQLPGLGRYIVLYYGSFRRLLAGRSRGEFRRQLRSTILHELRHHIEGLAGIDDLVKDDLAWLDRMWQEASRRGVAGEEEEE